MKLLIFFAVYRILLFDRVVLSIDDIMFAEETKLTHCCVVDEGLFLDVEGDYWLGQFVSYLEFFDYG